MGELLKIIYYLTYFDRRVLAIPIVTSLDSAILPLPKEFIVAGMSLLIAFASGLDGIFQWQHTWREYSRRIVQIETLIGWWEIQVAKAKQLSDPKDISASLGEAVEKLLRAVEEAVSAEMDAFFSVIPKLQTAQAPQASATSATEVRDE